MNNTFCPCHTDPEGLILTALGGASIFFSDHIGVRIRVSSRVVAEDKVYYLEMRGNNVFYESDSYPCLQSLLTAATDCHQTADSKRIVMGGLTRRQRAWVFVSEEQLVEVLSTISRAMIRERRGDSGSELLAI